LGIRRALGAGQTDILKPVIGQGLSFTIAGIGIGAAERFDYHYLAYFEVPETDI
jgi:hypothetical protein